MRWFFPFALLVLILSVAPTHAKEPDSADKPAKKEEAKETASLPHAYARDFKRFGFSDNYAGKIPHRTPSQEARVRVNKLLKGAKSYLLSRIEKSGKIAEFLYEPEGEKDRAAVNLKKPDTWFIQYRVEVPMSLVMALCVYQEAELDKKEEKKLLAALKFAVKKFESWQFDEHVGRISTEDLASRAGWILLAYEALHEIEQDSFTKSAIKVLKKQAKRIEKQLEFDWAANPHLFGSYLHGSRLARGRDFVDTYMATQALTFSPKRATKWRVKFAEELLAYLLEVHQIYPKVETPRYFKQAKVKEAGSPRPRYGHITGGKKGVKDKALIWHEDIVPERFLRETHKSPIESARQQKERALKMIKESKQAAFDRQGMAPFRIFLDLLRYLKSDETKKLRAKSTKKLVKKAEALIWNLVSSMVQARVSALNFRMSAGGGRGDYLHDLLDSRANDFTIISRSLRRKTYGQDDWYYDLAQSLLKKHTFAKDGSFSNEFPANSEAEQVNLERFRFTKNLIALHLLRQQPEGDRKKKPGPITGRKSKSSKSSKPEGGE